MAIYNLWTNLCDRSAMFTFDVDDLRNELMAWAKRKESFTSVALRILVLATRAPGARGGDASSTATQQKAVALMLFLPRFFTAR